MAFGLSAAQVALGGTILGAVTGGGGGSSSQSQTANRDPYAPAQPYILDNLKDTAALKEYYKKNMFNPLEQTSYQNMFGDLDNFRQNIAPNLMDFANNAMTSNYTRQRGGEPGSGGGYGGLMQPGGNKPNAQPRSFSVAPGKSYGLLDFKAMNPHTSGAIPAEPVKPVAAATSSMVPSAENNYLGQGIDNYNAIVNGYGNFTGGF